MALNNDNYLAVLRTAKAACDEGLIGQGDYDLVKQAFVRAQQIKVRRSSHLRKLNLYACAQSVASLSILRRIARGLNQKDRGGITSRKNALALGFPACVQAYAFSPRFRFVLAGGNGRRVSARRGLQACT